MSKRHNIAYVKPEEPNFLRKIKEQIGYKEGPTVETKNQPLAVPSDQDFEDLGEEQPQVVVLRSGDLTAEEAACEKLRLEKEEELKPADLSAPIIFKQPIKKNSTNQSSTNQQQDIAGQLSSAITAVTPTTTSTTSTVSKRSAKNQDSCDRTIKKLKSTKLLSFDQEEDQENEES